ncbi:MAG: hypothetical protein KDB54_07000 [Solirubrobacterales bacterium]|nr:hypothetical protein [Solirubrobacterales bacterium]MCB0860385.1 hypothetical protein [Solirubrobacterales bacterium]
MENSRTGIRSVIAALIAFLALSFALAPSASAADYTPQQRKEYFDSGKYSNDLATVAQAARNWIIRRTQPTLGKVRACRKAGYRIGKKDPGKNPNADYRVPVNVPKNQQPDRIVSAPDPGPDGQPTTLLPNNTVLKPAKKVKKITRSACAKMRRLAIAMDMDETAMSSFRYGSPQPNYDTYSMYRNEILGSQTALKPMLNLYKLAQKRGMATFVITARYEPLSADPLVGTILGNADLCDPGFSWAGACGLDVNNFNFTKVTRANLKNEGYTGLTDLYMRPPDSPSKGEVKNSERAEISLRRGYRIIAMFGDQSSDLEKGFYERGFKYQSPVGD